MENYYDFTKGVLLISGIDFGNHWKLSKLLLLQRYLALFIEFSGSIQSFMFFAYDDSKGYQKIMSLVMGVFAGQGFVKQLTVIREKEHLAAIMDQLKVLHEQFDESEKQRSVKFLQGIRNLCVIFFKMLLACVTNVAAMPVVILVVSLLTKGETKLELGFGLWWPFDPMDYYFYVYAFEVYWIYMHTIIPNSLDQLTFLMLAEYISLFEQLGEKVERVINEALDNPFDKTRRDLHQCIRLHNELMALFDEFNGIFGTPLLAQLLSFSGIIGLLGLIVIVSRHNFSKLLIFLVLFSRIRSSCTQFQLPFQCLVASL